VQPLLNLDSRERLWWYALIAINQENWKHAELILSALSPDPDPDLNKKIDAARWFLLWRRDNSIQAIEKIAALNQPDQQSETDTAIAYLLTLIDIDRGLIKHALDKACALIDTPEPHAFWYGHSLGRWMQPNLSK